MGQGLECVRERDWLAATGLGGEAVGSRGDGAGKEGCGRARMTLSAVRKCLAVNRQPIRSTWSIRAGE